MSANKRTNIIVNLQYAAIHYWKNCDIPEVRFLKNPHRHIFHITCKKAVDHNDRDIEFIVLKNQINTWLQNTFNNDLGYRSCEHLCHELIEQFDLNYARVLEDGENGSEVSLDV